MGFKYTNTKSRSQTNEDVVVEFFSLIEGKNIDRLLNLFSEDSVIYEQFSKIEGGLRGKSAIEPFLKVSIMAIDGSQHQIKFEPRSQLDTNIANNNNKVVNALVKFQKGDILKARFTFEFDGSNEIKSHQIETRTIIKTLSIQFFK